MDFIGEVKNLFKKEVPKVVVITGASAGVGRAVAWEFAQMGCSIALLARGAEGLEGAKKEVEQLGGKAMVIQVDVADAEAVEKAAEEVEQQLGPIDVWVNNAMISVFAPVDQTLAGEYKRVTEVNYLGYVYGTLAALKRMKPRNKGSIVMVGSALAYRGIPLQSAYCASKHAIEGFFDSFRTELMHEKSKIKTCMVQLPALNTTQFSFVRNKLPFKTRPMGKIYQPELAAKAIVYASMHNRREIFVGYPTVQAILGDKLAPWFADWVLSRNGFEGQQTNIPEDPNKPDNIFKPIDGDHGSHGTFDQEATSFSLELLVSMNKKIIVGALATVALVASIIVNRKISGEVKGIYI